jgi:hypothetical protein
MAGNALIPAARAQEIIALDTFTRQSRNEIAEARKAGHEMLVALATARAYQGIRELLTDAMLADVKALANSQLGYKTDHDPKKPGKDGRIPTPYGDEVIRDCFITATLRGARCVGNEFNVLGGNTYLTKEFYERQCREFPGVTAFDPRIGSPEYSQDHKTARCVCVARWKLNGYADSITFHIVRDDAGKVATDERISVRVNAGQSDDQVIGKAMKKLCQRVLTRLQGLPADLAPEDGDEPDGIEDAEVIRTERVSPAAAASATPTGPHPMPADKFGSVAQFLFAADQITEVQRIAAEVRKGYALTPDQGVQLDAWEAEAADKIRERRGPRANGKSETA